MFGEGISQSGEILDLGVDLGIINKSGAWFSYNGAKLAQGRDAAKRVIADNPELADELSAKIMESLKSGQKAPAKPTKKSTKADEDGEQPKADEPARDTLDFDSDLPDDPFSIEEDI